MRAPRPHLLAAALSMGAAACSSATLPGAASDVGPPSEAGPVTDLGADAEGRDGDAVDAENTAQATDAEVPGRDAQAPPGVRRLTGRARTAACFSSPPAEGAQELIDGDPNTKFLAVASAPWVEIDTGGPYVLSGYAAISGNDAPERDPVRWLLEGSNDGLSWRTLDVQVDRHFSQRRERQEFALAPDGFHRWFRFRPENAGGTMTQLAELELLGTPAYTAPAAAPPRAPHGLQIEPISRTELALSWTDQASDEDAFRIERADDGVRFETVAYAPANAGGIALSRLEPGARAAYRVLAENAAGASAPSEVVIAAPLPALVGQAVGGALRFEDAGYALVVTDDAPGQVPEWTIARIVEEFFSAYPRMAADFNPRAPREVALRFDPTYDGVAEASVDRIRISTAYAASAPDDIDVIVHEGFHLIQAYTQGEHPGWAVEGLADYARWAYGVKNNAACWTLQRYEPGQNYTDAYGVTARFFLWLAAAYGAGLPRALDAALREGRYDDGFFPAQTGKTIDALWADYAADTRRPPVSLE